MSETKSELTIQYQVVEMQEVVKYFVEGYKAKVHSYDWFLDATKGKIVLRLYLRQPAEALRATHASDCAVRQKEYCGGPCTCGVASPSDHSPLTPQASPNTKP